MNKLSNSKLIDICFESLRSSKLLFRFVTNTTKESQNFLYNRLKTIGFDIKKEEIFSSLLAAKQFIKKSKLNPYLMLESEAIEDFEDIIDSKQELNDNNGIHWKDFFL